jgi:hypothetical protein
MSTSTTEYARRFWRHQEYLVETVEHYNHITRRRKDLFNMFDLLAIPSLEDCVDNTLAIQVTSLENVSARITKLRERSTILAHLWSVGWITMVEGWGRKNGMVRCRRLTVLERGDHEMVFDLKTLDEPINVRTRWRYLGQSWQELELGSIPADYVDGTPVLQ